MRLLTLPTLSVVLLAWLPSISAFPIYNKGATSLSHRDRSYPEGIVERYDDTLNAQRHDKYVTLFTRAKITAAQQAARKQQVKDKIAAHQNANREKKHDLQEKKARNPNAPHNLKGRPGKAPQPGKPSPPGWRANSRQKGRILPKEPKTPKPNAAKGAAKSDKALKTQKAAYDKATARRTAGRDKFREAAAAHKATTGLPGRQDTFTERPGSPTYTGKDARIAMFNSHLHFTSPVGLNALGKNKKASDRMPKQFNNAPHAVPKPGTTSPIDGMIGKGHEYPITYGNRKGYHGALVDLGPARIIRQENGISKTVKIGSAPVPETTFRGVIGHDSSRARNAPGSNDHFSIPKTSHTIRHTLSEDTEGRIDGIPGLGIIH